MARYKLKNEAFMTDRLVKAGTEIDYDGEPGDNLEPLDAEAKAAKKAAAARRAAAAKNAGASVTIVEGGASSRKIEALESTIADLEKANAALTLESTKNAEALADALQAQTVAEAALAAANARIAELEKTGGAKQDQAKSDGGKPGKPAG